MLKELRNKKMFRKCQQIIAKATDHLSNHDKNKLIFNAQYIIKSYPNYYYGYYALGTGYTYVGKYKLAGKLLKKAINYNSKSSISYNSLALVYRLQQKFQLSLKTERIAIHLHPYMAVNYNKLGVIYSYLNRDDLALKYYKKSEKMGYRHPIVYSNIGETEAGHHPKQAIKYIRKAIKLGYCDKGLLNTYGDLLNTLGAKYFNLSKYDLALKYQKKAKKLGYRDTCVYDNIGLDEMHLGHYLRARHYIRKAIKFGPKNSGYYENLVLTYRKFHRINLAKAVIPNAIQRYKNDKDMVAKLARVEYNLNEYESSIRYSKFAVKLGYQGIYPYETIAMSYSALRKFAMAKKLYLYLIKSGHYNKAYYNIAKLEYDIKDYKTSAKHIMKYIKIMRKLNHPNVDYYQLSYRLLGKNYFELEKYENSKKAFQEAVSIRCNEENVYDLAHVEYLLKQYRNSLRHVREAIRLYPQVNDNFWLLGCIYEDMGDFYNAEKADKRAVKLCPTNPYNLYHLAYVEYRKGQYSLALKHVRRAIKLQPKDSINNLLLLGYVYKQVKQYKKSIKVFKRAIAYGAANNINVYLGLSNDYNNLKNYMIAAKYASMALAIDSQNMQALCSLGVNTFDTGGENMDLGMNYIRKAIEFHPKDYYGYVSLAICYLMRNRPDIYMDFINIAERLNKAGCLQMLNHCPMGTR